MCKIPSLMCMYEKTWLIAMTNKAIVLHKTNQYAHIDWMTELNFDSHAEELFSVTYIHVLVTNRFNFSSEIILSYFLSNSLHNTFGIITGTDARLQIGIFLNKFMWEKNSDSNFPCTGSPVQCSSINYGSFMPDLITLLDLSATKCCVCY